MAVIAALSASLVLARDALELGNIALSHSAHEEAWLQFLCPLAQNASGESSPRFEIALVLVCFDHVASVIVNANHGMM